MQKVIRTKIFEEFIIFFKMQIEKNVQYISGYDHYIDELLELPQLSSRVVLLYASWVMLPVGI